MLYSFYSFSLLRFISLKKLKTYISFDYDKAIEYLNSQIMDKNEFADVKLCDSDQVLGFFFLIDFLYGNYVVRKWYKVYKQ